MGKNTIRGGRFVADSAKAFDDINSSNAIDRRFYKQDIEASLAHSQMLARQGIISDEEARAIADGLGAIKREISEGRFEFSDALEDIHMNIEAALHEKIGTPALKLHTGRSRNDQVVTDFRLWVREDIDALEQALKELQAVLIEAAERFAALPMPGLTHLQTAQPVTFGHHLLAYVEMLGRDRGRLRDCRKRVNESPLGAAALAGTSFPIDRQMTATTLKFEKVMENSLDAVSSRDFALEYMALLAILMTHLSRLAEEIVFWSSEYAGFIILDEAWRTGSSIMPQKRNPDAAELVRAKAGRVFGALVTLLTVIKALPLAYSKDLQEDKPALFEASDTVRLVLPAMAGMLSSFQARPEAMRQALERGHPTATDLADWCVRVAGLPFREAHHITGLIVRKADEEKCGIADLSLETLQAIDKRITAEVFSALSIEASLESRKSFGGTAPEAVKEAVGRAKKRFLD